MTKGLLGGFAAIAIVATMAASAPAAAQEANWTGPYAGGHVGWGFGDTDLIAGTKNGIDFWENDHDTDGVLGGFQIGLDRQFGSVVVGVVGDFSFADIDGDATSCQCGDNYVGSKSESPGGPGESSGRELSI